MSTEVEGLIDSTLGHLGGRVRSKRSCYSTGRIHVKTFTEVFTTKVMAARNTATLSIVLEGYL